MGREGHLPRGRPARLDLAHPRPARRRPRPLQHGACRPEGAPGLQGPAGYHCHPRHDELSEDDKMTVARARKVERFMSQPFHVAEIFTGKPGKFVSLDQSVTGFKGLLAGQYDDLPEAAFYMVAPIEEVVEKAAAMALEVEA